MFCSQIVHFAVKSFSKLPPHLLNQLIAMRWPVRSARRRGGRNDWPSDSRGKTAGSVRKLGGGEGVYRPQESHAFAERFKCKNLAPIALLNDLIKNDI